MRWTILCAAALLVVSCSAAEAKGPGMMPPGRSPHPVGPPPPHIERQRLPQVPSPVPRPASPTRYRTVPATAAKPLPPMPGATPALPPAGIPPTPVTPLQLPQVPSPVPRPAPTPLRPYFPAPGRYVPYGGMTPSAAEREEMRYDWYRTRTGQATPEEEDRFRALLRKYPNYDYKE